MGERAGGEVQDGCRGFVCTMPVSVRVSVGHWGGLGGASVSRQHGWLCLRARPGQTVWSSNPAHGSPSSYPTIKAFHAVSLPPPSFPLLFMLPPLLQRPVNITAS